MASLKLTVAVVDLRGTTLILSDGHKYLVRDEDYAIAATWKPGLTVHLTTVGYPPNGCELRSDQNLSESIIAIRS